MTHLFKNWHSPERLEERRERIKASLKIPSKQTACGEWKLGDRLVDMYWVLNTNATLDCPECVAELVKLKLIGDLGITG